MSSFTKPLIVKKLPNGLWEVARSFTYHIGSEEGKEWVEIPRGFITDFASVPRLFWIVLPPDGNYTQAAVLHDYLYSKALFKRKKCDDIFLEAMKVLKVPYWKRKTIHLAVRMFAWLCWNKRQEVIIKKLL